MKSSPIYPSLSFDPSLNHRAHTFSIRFGVQIIPEFKTPDGFEDDVTQLYEEHYRDWMKRFPDYARLDEQTSKEQDEFATAFTEVDTPIRYSESGPRRIIENQEPPMASNLSFKLEDGGFLSSELHNCPVQYTAVLMYTHGLKSLAEIYRSFDIYPTFLPVLTFDKSRLTIRIPYEKNPGDLAHDNFDGVAEDYSKRTQQPIESDQGGYFGNLSVAGIEQVLERESDEAGSFVSRIPINLGDNLKISEVARDLLAIGSYRAQSLHVLRDMI
jgi:hypothetical protein